MKHMYPLAEKHMKAAKHQMYDAKKQSSKTAKKPQKRSQTKGMIKTAVHAAKHFRRKMY